MAASFRPKTVFAVGGLLKVQFFDLFCHPGLGHPRLGICYNSMKDNAVIGEQTPTARKTSKHRPMTPHLSQSNLSVLG